MVGKGGRGGRGEIGAINYSARTGPRSQIAPEGRGAGIIPLLVLQKSAHNTIFWCTQGKGKSCQGPGGQCVWISWHLITLLHLHLFPSGRKYNLRSWPHYKRQFCVLTAGAGVPPSCIWVIMCGRAVPPVQVYKSRGGV